MTISSWEVDLTRLEGDRDIEATFFGIPSMFSVTKATFLVSVHLSISDSKMKFSIYLIRELLGFMKYQVKCH